MADRRRTARELGDGITTLHGGRELLQQQRVTCTKPVGSFQDGVIDRMPDRSVDQVRRGIQAQRAQVFHGGVA
ncbi:MAG: hypothetical protein J2P57_07265, partial [Acidimicrobiaceae bacterium]|nr:hypothetical protein [Acidimicrobiaceae bacterium]